MPPPPTQDNDGWDMLANPFKTVKIDSTDEKISVRKAPSVNFNGGTGRKSLNDDIKKMMAN